MTELREKMIKAMQLRNLLPNTQQAYLSAVRGLAKHYGKSPDQISKQMIEDYILYLKNDKGRAPNSVSGIMTALRFFYQSVLCVEEKILEFSVKRKPRANCSNSAVGSIRSFISGLITSMVIIYPLWCYNYLRYTVI